MRVISNIFSINSYLENQNTSNANIIRYVTNTTIKTDVAEEIETTDGVHLLSFPNWFARWFVTIHLGGKRILHLSLEKRTQSCCTAKCKKWMHSFFFSWAICWIAKVETTLIKPFFYVQTGRDISKKKEKKTQQKAKDYIVSSHVLLVRCWFFFSFCHISLPRHLFVSSWFRWAARASAPSPQLSFMCDI